MITKIGHHCHIKAIVSQGAFNTWKTLDWAHNICVKGKLKTNRGPNILRAQNIVGQKGRLKTIYGQNILNQILPISSKPLDSQPSLVSRWRQKKGNANFENHMLPKCPRSCLVAQRALMNSMIQETPNSVCHLFFFSKDDNFWRSSLVRSSIHYCSFHCRNKPLSTINWNLSSPHLGLCKLP